MVASSTQWFRVLPEEAASISCVSTSYLAINSMIFSCLFFPVLPVNSPLMGISISILYVFKRIPSYIIVGPVSEPSKYPRGFPDGSWVKNLPAMQETQEMWVQSLGTEGPLE